MKKLVELKQTCTLPEQWEAYTVDNERVYAWASRTGEVCVELNSELIFQSLESTPLKALSCLFIIPHDVFWGVRKDHE